MWAPVLRIAWAAALMQLPAFPEAPPQMVSHRLLVEDIYETVYSVRTGNGPHDRIQVHRVVRESRGRPVETAKTVMLLHGDVWGFDGAFLGAGAPASSLAVFLARQHTDVWGVDLGWTLVPKETTDFTFMKDWGMQRDIDDVSRALDLAQKLRRGNRPLPLLGWSRGGPLAYGLVNQESQRPCARRRVSGLIPVDTLLETNDEGSRASTCGAVAELNAQIASGNYVSTNPLDEFGALAESDPTGASPFIPGVTNYQAVLIIGAAPFPSLTPFYHWLAGVFPQNDPAQIPVGFAHTDVSRFNAFLKAARPHEPNAMMRDTMQVTCETGPSGPFDNHLRDIKVPVLYLGAAGGIGTFGDFTLSLLRNSRVERHVVRLLPPGQEMLDYGHMDLFYGRNAQELAWRKLDRWLFAQTYRDVCSCNE